MALKPNAASLIQRTKDAALARNKARLAELVALIRRRLTEVVEGFYDIGEALREILDHKLYGAAGHKSFSALLKAEGMLSLRQANKLIAVVRSVPREQALSLGQERAYALVVYTQATPEDDTPAGLLQSGATVGGSPVAKASVRQIAAATQKLRARSPRPPTRAERARAKADAALLKGLRAVLRTAGIGRAELSLGRDAVTIKISRTLAKRVAEE